MEYLILIVFFGLCGFLVAYHIYKISQKHECAPKLIHYPMLLNACFDDQCHAKRLVQIEKNLDHTISDEEAAARALEKLLSEVRSKRRMRSKTSRAITIDFLTD